MRDVECLDEGGEDQQNPENALRINRYIKKSLSIDIVVARTCSPKIIMRDVECAAKGGMDQQKPEDPFLIKRYIKNNFSTESGRKDM